MVASSEGAAGLGDTGHAELWVAMAVLICWLGLVKTADTAMAARHTVREVSAGRHTLEAGPEQLYFSVVATYSGFPFLIEFGWTPAGFSAGYIAVAMGFPTPVGV